MRRFLALFRRRNPLQAVPAYARIDREIAEARKHHRPVRHLQERKAALVHQALRAGR
jgi:hypothetical protein